MKVLMLTPDSAMIDRRILLEAETLVNSGYSVTLLAGFECEKEEHYTYKGINIHRYQYDWDDERLKKIRKFLMNWFRRESLVALVNRFYMALARRFFEVTPYETFVIARAEQFQAGIVHVHDLPCLKIGAILAQKWKVPLVYDAHEIYYEQNCLPIRSQRLLERTEARYIDKVNLMITVNEAIAQYFQSKYSIAHPLVLMNCTNLPEKGIHPNARQELRCQLGLDTNTTIILYQGWISNERNLDTLVKSAAFFPPNAVLVIIGYGAYEATLKQIVTEQNLEKQVFFLGKVPSDEILNFTAGADIGVIPYLPIDLNHELCSPNKFFEYVLAGVPIITHKLPFFEQMAAQYGGVLVGDMSTANSIAEVINKLVNNTDKRTQLQQNLEQSSQVLNWKTEGEKLLAAYGSLGKSTINVR
ncbi:MAG: glycosyltransferase [Coleofasciculaceae cyanobacterium]